MKLINKSKKILLVIISASLVFIIIYNKNKILSPSNTTPQLISSINFDETLNDRLQIEVLNGCGVKGIADLYTNYLRKNGYDVINYKNAENFSYNSTIILIHKNNLNTNHFKNLMKIDPLNIKNLFDEKIFFDLTLIIGKDYKKLESYNEVSMYYEPFQ